jgi:hypothetical protein
MPEETKPQTYGPANPHPLSTMEMLNGSLGMHPTARTPGSISMLERMLAVGIP